MIKKLQNDNGKNSNKVSSVYKNVLNPAIQVIKRSILLDIMTKKRKYLYTQKWAR